MSILVLGPQGVVVLLAGAEIDHVVLLGRAARSLSGKATREFGFVGHVSHEGLLPDRVEPFRAVAQWHALFQAVIGGHDVVRGLNAPAALRCRRATASSSAVIQRP